MAKKKSSSRLDLTSATTATTINTRHNEESGSSATEIQGINNVNEFVVNERQLQQQPVNTTDSRNKKVTKSSTKVTSLSKSKSTLSLGPSSSTVTDVPTTVSTTSHNTLLSPAWIANFFCLNKKKKSKLTINGDNSKSDNNQTDGEKCCKHKQSPKHLCDANCTIQSRNSRLRDSISPEYLPEDVIKELKQTLTTNNYNNQGKTTG